MCGRFVSATAPADLAGYFGTAAPEVDLPRNFNVAPTMDVYAVVGDRSDSGSPGRRLDTFRWGLVPSWAKDERIGNRMINARAETIDSKQSFRAAFRRRRCLVPATGFYEWRTLTNLHGGRPAKQPVFIHRGDGEPLAMAGLWEQWRGPDRDWSEVLHSVTVVTTEANGFMQPIHDRMPVLLARRHWEEWLDPGNEDVDHLKALLVPAPEGLLAAHEVDPLVGNVRNNGPALIEPYEPAPEMD